jgi:hypothetical protein
MKLLQAGPDGLTFQLGEGEKQLLVAILRLYPMIPKSHLPLCRGEPRPEDQALLDDALAAQRASNKLCLDKLMQAGNRFRKIEDGQRFSLKHSEVETLLQALNDLRVGCWLRLGSPDSLNNIVRNDDRHVEPLVWIMEAAAGFETEILQALTNTGDRHCGALPPQET